MLLILAFALGAASPTASIAPAADPRTLQCTAHNTSAGKDRKCTIKLPKGAQLRPCAAADRAAARCDLDSSKRVVAWVTSTGGARCALSKKKTDWKKRVAIKVAKDTAPGAGSCTLFVSLR